MIDQLSAWIDKHQLLVISVFMPILSIFVAVGSSWYATRKALKFDRIKMNFEREVKLAEFRQAWIDNLRDELAEFQSYGILPNSDPQKQREFYKLGTKIELLMNPDES